MLRKPSLQLGWIDCLPSRALPFAFVEPGAFVIGVVKVTGPSDAGRPIQETRTLQAHRRP